MVSMVVVVLCLVASSCPIKSGVEVVGNRVYDKPPE